MLALHCETIENKTFVKGIFELGFPGQPSEYISEDEISNFNSINEFFEVSNKECVHNFFGIDFIIDTPFLVTDPQNQNKYIIDTQLDHYKQYVINNLKQKISQRLFATLPNWKQINAIEDKIKATTTLISLLGQNEQYYYNKVYAFLPPTPYTKINLANYLNESTIRAMNLSSLISGIAPEKLVAVTDCYVDLIKSLAIYEYIRLGRNFVNTNEATILACTELSEIPVITDEQINIIV